jgi:hypothetical protein
MKPTEQHLADFVLGMARDTPTLQSQWRRYVKECLALWEKVYGKRVAERARALIDKDDVKKAEK